MTEDRVAQIRAQFESHVRSLPNYYEGQLETNRSGAYSSIQVDSWFTGFVMAVNARAE